MSRAPGTGWRALDAGEHRGRWTASRGLIVLAAVVVLIAGRIGPALSVEVTDDAPGSATDAAPATSGAAAGAVETVGSAGTGSGTPSSAASAFVADAADEAAAAIGRSIDEIRSSVQDPGERRKRSRETLTGARRLLISRGLDEDLASALTSVQTSAITTAADPEVEGDAAGSARADAGPFGDDSSGEPRPHALLALQIVKTRLEAFAAAARSGSAVRPPSDARARVETILRDPIFEASRPQQPGLLRRFFERMRLLIRDLLFAVSKSISLHVSLVGALIVLFMISALAIAALRIAALLRGRPVRTAPGSIPESRAEPPPAATTLDELVVRARAEAAAGRLEAAMRLFEKAGVQAMRASGELPSRHGLTDLEGVALLRERGGGARSGAFARLAELHDRSIYAGRRVNPEIVTEAASLVETLAVPDGARAGGAR